MSVTGLKEAVAALNRLSRFAVPQAQARAVNRVAKRVVSQSLREVAKTLNVGDNDHQGIPLRAIKRRARVTRSASLAKPSAEIFANCQPLPVINLLSSPPTAPARAKRGRSLKVGPYRFRNGFIAQAPNGYWQVFERVGQARNPIRVIKISVVHTMTQVLRTQTVLRMKEDMPKELGHELTYLLNEMRKT